MNNCCGPSIWWKSAVQIKWISEMGWLEHWPNSFGCFWSPKYSCPFIRRTENSKLVRVRFGIFKKVERLIWRNYEVFRDHQWFFVNFLTDSSQPLSFLWNFGKYASVMSKNVTNFRALCKNLDFYPRLSLQLEPSRMTSSFDENNPKYWVFFKKLHIRVAARGVSIALLLLVAIHLIQACYVLKIWTFLF